MFRSLKGSKGLRCVNAKVGIKALAIYKKGHKYKTTSSSTSNIQKFRDDGYIVLALKPISMARHLHMFVFRRHTSQLSAVICSNKLPSYNTNQSIGTVNLLWNRYALKSLFDVEPTCASIAA